MTETRDQGIGGAKAHRANTDQVERGAPAGGRKGRILSGRRLGRFRNARRHQGTRALHRPVPPSAFSRHLSPCAAGRTRPRTTRCSSDTMSPLPLARRFSRMSGSTMSRRFAASDAILPQHRARQLGCFSRSSPGPWSRSPSLHSGSSASLAAQASGILSPARPKARRRSA